MPGGERRREEEGGLQLLEKEGSGPHAERSNLFYLGSSKMKQKSNLLVTWKSSLGEVVVKV